MKNKKGNKRGMALGTLAMLILAAISLAIALGFFIKTGLITNLQTITCTFLTTVGSYTRGLLIQMMMVLFAVMTALLAFMLFVGFPPGKTLCITLAEKTYGLYTAACALVYAAALVTLSLSIVFWMNNAPLINCQSPNLRVGDPGGVCEAAGADIEAFQREVRERTVDCWQMFAEGRFDPLAGKVPPNPRTCFVIKFNLKEPIPIINLTLDMKNKTYNPYLGFGEEKSYWDQAGKGIILENSKNIIPSLSKTVQKGTMFIKYGDDVGAYNLLAEEADDIRWTDADCRINRLYNPPNRANLFKDYFNAFKDIFGEDSATSALVKGYVSDTFQRSQSATNAAANLSNLVTDRLETMSTDGFGNVVIGGLTPEKQENFEEAATRAILEDIDKEYAPDAALALEITSEVRTMVSAATDQIVISATFPSSAVASLATDFGGFYVDMAVATGKFIANEIVGNDYVYWCFGKDTIKDCNDPSDTW